MDIYTSISLLLDAGFEIGLIKQGTDVFCEIRTGKKLAHITISTGISQAVNGTVEWWLLKSATPPSAELRAVLANAIRNGRMTTGQLVSLSAWTDTGVREAAIAQLAALGAR